MDTGKAHVENLDTDTALRALGDGSYAAEMSRRWWVQAGPNGGYLAALILRALLSELDPQGKGERVVRSMHVRYLKPAGEGEVTIHVSTLQAGRSMTTLAARLVQAGRDIVLASATFSAPLSAIAFQDSSMPTLPAVGQCEAIEKRIELNHRWDMYRGIGGAFRSGERALTGGHIRLAEPRIPDALTLAAVWDAWPPAVFARAIDQRFKGAVPTVEVSIVFRHAGPLPGLGAGDYLVIQAESDAARDGLTEEVAQVWSPGGELLARSRQLALLF